ncbi:allophanate hydrolase-related protein [Demequina litorisediminis]|nr:hypothetical protein [Demequina litorisediminis]
MASRGAVLVRRTSTAPGYRMYALNTVPPKPGLIRDTASDGAIVGEIWRLTAAGFGSFVDDLPAPMAIGSVALDGGDVVSGFLCEPYATDGALDITSSGDWVSWLASRAHETCP